VTIDVALFDEPDKTCRRCRIAKPASEFHRKGNSVRRRSRCASCRLETEGHSRRGKRTAESRLRERLSKYGLTVEQYQDMFAAQGGTCAICHTPPTATARLVVDHCHTSGRVRALLCRTCNTHLGAYEKLRDQATAYLDQYGAGNPLLNHDAPQKTP